MLAGYRSQHADTVDVIAAGRRVTIGMFRLEIQLLFEIYEALEPGAPRYRT